MTVSVIGCSQPDHFTLKGKIPGTVEGMTAQLKKKMGGDEVAYSTYIKDDEFELTGVANTPTFYYLYISNDSLMNYCLPANSKEKRVRINIPVFIENGEMKVSATHLDSMSRRRGFATELRSDQITIEGSESHELYTEFLSALAPYDNRQNELILEFFEELKSNEYTKEEEMVAKEKMDAKIKPLKKQVDSLRIAFAVNNPYPGVSIEVLKSINMSAFAYNEAELDKIIEIVKRLPEGGGEKELFLKKVRDNKKYVIGISYHDLPTLEAEGQAGSLSDYVAKDQFTLIDFWASWCGPCRKAIPHMKKINKLYGEDALTMISFSTDDSHEDWKKAMKDEDMPWLQLIGRENYLQLLGEHYKLKGIPLLVLVDPNGIIQCATNSPSDIDAKLKELVGDRFI